MVISEKSSYLDPLVMNSSTTTGGRWCTPASNAESFMSSSPSYCVAASPGGGWGAQGELASRALSLIAVKAIESLQAIPMPVLRSGSLNLDPILCFELSSP